MDKKRIIILGAGLAGLSAAWHLQRRGIDCQVFEKEPEVGGLCRSKNIDGFTFDFDGHLLHFKHSYAFNFIKGLLGNKLACHERESRIYSHSSYIRYPFQANLYGLPKLVVQDCLLGLIEAHNNGHKTINKDNSFHDWIIQNFGKGIARHFMIPYNTKFWTQPPKRLTCGWLDGFIPVPSLKEVIEGTIEESQRQFGYNARFWYPKRGGIGLVPLLLASQIKNINTNNPIAEINLTKKEIKTATGIKARYDYLISTIPLPEMPLIVRGMPQEVRSSFKKLKWNSIFNVNLGIDKKNNPGKHWIYFPEGNVCFFRVGFPHNFSNAVTPPNKGSLYVEIAYSKDKTIEKDRITLQIKEDLEKVGVLSRDERILAQDINDIKYGYPIYDINYRKARERIVKFFIGNNIIPCGRYGSWRYMSMEDVILDGKNITECIMKNA